jgi:hypothetical protein
MIPYRLLDRKVDPGGRQRGPQCSAGIKSRIVEAERQEPSIVRGIHVKAVVDINHDWSDCSGAAPIFAEFKSMTSAVLSKVMGNAVDRISLFVEQPRAITDSRLDLPH